MIEGIIYKATNILNGMVYIGLTTRSLEARRNEHLRKAKQKDGRSGKYFHNSISKYGEENFTWEVIEKSYNKENLLEKEIYWIEFYKSFGLNGYNMTKGGETSGKRRHIQHDL